MPSLPAFLVATLLELAVLCALVGLSRGSEVRVSPKLRPTDFGDFETSCLTDVAANLAEVVWVERVDLSSVYRHVPWAVPPRPFRMLLKRGDSCRAPAVADGSVPGPLDMTISTLPCRPRR